MTYSSAKSRRYGGKVFFTYVSHLKHLSAGSLLFTNYAVDDPTKTENIFNNSIILNS